MKHKLVATWEGPALNDNDQGNLKWLVSCCIAKKVYNDEARQIEVQTSLRFMPERKTILADGSGNGYFGYQFEGAFPVISHSSRPVTGNEAEYMAVEAAVIAALHTGTRGWCIYSDSLQVVNQLQGNWQISEKFIPYVERIRKLMKDADAVVEWAAKDFHVGKFVKERVSK